MYTRVCIELPSGLARCAHPPPHNPINGCRAPLHARLAHRHAPTWLANLLTSPQWQQSLQLLTAVVHRRGHACAISLELLPSNDITPQERGSPPLHTVSPPPLTIGGGILYHLPLNTHTRTICKKLNTRAVTARRKGAGSSGKTGLLLYTERKKKKRRNKPMCVCIHIYIKKI